MLDQPIIKLAQVSKTYIKDKHPIAAVRSVELTIKRGEFVAITGPSGGGKSSLLQMMGGLERPSEGSVWIDGANLAQLSDSELASFRNTKLGFVFQDALLQPFLTVAQNIRLPGMFGSPAGGGLSVLELARIVGLQDRLSHLPRELSGGEAQRCAIARALFNRPAILCADEPTGNLDTANANTVIELFRHIKSELATTIVIVTHDVKQARKADRVLRIEKGQLYD